MSPIYDKARLRDYLDSWSGDRKKFPEAAINDFCTMLTDESGVQVGSKIVVTRGPHDGAELVVRHMNPSEAEVYAAPQGGGSPSGWWPIEMMRVKGRKERPARQVAGVR